MSIEKMRWSNAKGEDIVSPPEIEDFLVELEALYRKYDISISHEDHHGAFEFENFSDYNLSWIKDGHIADDYELED